MNTNKANNGWTLHPSKSFPGRFYYFNVLNGQSAWTSGPEVGIINEKNISKDSGFHNLSDKRYFYPTEPTTPPEDYPSPSSTVPHILNQPKFTRQSERQRDFSNRTDQYPSPTFGKAVFPNYVSNVDPYRQNIVWAPLPIPTVPYVYNISEVRSSKETWCQTSDIDRLHVDACDTSLSKRFTNYNPKLKYVTSTPIKTKNEATTQSFIPIFRETPLTSPSRSLNRETIFRRVRSKSETESTITSPELLKSKSLDSLFSTDDITDLSYTKIKTKSKEPVKQTHLVFDKDTNITLEDFESNDLDNVFDHNEPQSRKRNKYCQENILNFNEDTYIIYEPATKLPKNDLRLMLIAKRRKSVDFGEIQGLTSKKIKTYKEEQKNPTTPTKRVSFNLEVRDDSDTSNNQSEDKMQLQSDDKDPDNVLLSLHEDLWYVMVDPETLVDEYQLIEEYVLSDDSCRLLLPRCLRSEIEAMGMGDCRGRKRVIVARQSARKLAQPLDHIVTMPEINISTNTKDISDILKYCLKINSFGNKVVFITNSSKLLTDAKLLKIPCLNTTEIKLKNTNTNEITFDLKKVKINIRNDRSENITLPPTESKHYVLGNKKGNPESESLFKSVNNSEDNILLPTSKFKHYAFENKTPFSEIKTNLFEKSSDKNISEVKKFDDFKNVKISARNERSENIALAPSESKRYVLGNKEANPKNEQSEENIFLQTCQFKHYSFENKEPFTEIKTNLFEKSSDKNISEVNNFDELKKVKVSVRNERSENIALLPSECKRFILGNKEVNPKNRQSEGNILLQTCEFKHCSFENKEPFTETKTNLFEKSTDKNNSEVKKFDELKKVKINVKNKHRENIALLPSESKRYVLGNKEVNKKNEKSEENIFLQTCQFKHYSFENKEPFPEIKTNLFEKSLDINISDVKNVDNLKKVKISVRNERNENIALAPSESKRYIFGNKEANPKNGQIEENIFLRTSEFKRYIFENKEPFSDVKENLCENSSNKNSSKVKKVDANTSPIGSDKLIDITRKKTETNQNEKELIDYEKAAASIGIDIQKLFLNDEKKAQQSSIAKKQKVNLNKLEIKKPKVIKNTKKVSIEKGESSIKNVLKKFDIKSNQMEETIRTRLDEWICCFSQIVEDALTQVLTRHKKVKDSMTPPWVLYDVVDSIKKLYDSHKDVKTSADKLTTILLEQCSQIGKLKLSMKPTDFMDLFECAFLLIQKLKTSQPTYLELLDAENALNDLLREIENPPEDQNLLLPFTPAVSTSDILIERVRENYLRHPSEIIDYLKKHFDEWKNYEQTQEKGFGEHPIVNNNGDIRIVRTCGRNLKLLNIHGKSLTVTNPTETVPKDKTGNTKEDNVTSTNDINEDLDISNSETCIEELSNDETVDGTVKCGNTSNEDPKSRIQENNQSVATPSLNNLSKDNKNNGPKVITETKKTILDLEALNYSGIQETDTFISSSVHDDNNDVKYDSDVSIADTVSFVYQIKYTNVKNNTAVKNKNVVAESNVKTRDASIDRFDSFNVKDESTTDSGFESESLHAYSLVKTFLFELTYTFKMVYSFVVKTIKDFRENKVQEEQKHYLHKKANLMYMTIAEIIIKLKMIIQRESTENTELKTMLLRAGVQAAADKRILRYSQVVTKCLEQAVTLKDSLKIILSLTGDDYDGSISTCTLDTNIRYFNIFE